MTHVTVAPVSIRPAESVEPGFRKFEVRIYEGSEDIGNRFSQSRTSDFRDWSITTITIRVVLCYFHHLEGTSWQP